MPITLTTPVTGSAQTGFATPGYTIAVDNPPDTLSKQWLITALTGTQGTATAQTAADNPFTITFFRPKGFNASPAINGVGVLSGVPKRNVWKYVVRKGMPVNGADTRKFVSVLRGEISIPAGAETTSASEIRAMLSLTFGALSQCSASFGDSIVSGSL